MSADLRRDGVIHDIGYQRYTGQRLGRWYSMRSLFEYSLRTAYGLGRGGKSKILPIGLLAVAGITALILVVVSSQLPDPVTAFVAIVAPELASRDLRNNLHTLYFSRPLGRSDYALTKLTALVAAVFVLFATPMLVMFVGMAFNTDDGLRGVLTEAGDFAVGLVAALIHAIVLAALAMPLAALTGRRVFATGMIIALFLLTAPITGVFTAIGGDTLAQLAGLFDPISLLNGVDNWLFDDGMIDVGSYGPVYGLTAAALTAIGTTLLVWRYRKVKS
jgi:ABC-2 type transport system permease protein